MAKKQTNSHSESQIKEDGTVATLECHSESQIKEDGTVATLESPGSFEGIDPRTIAPPDAMIGSPLSDIETAPRQSPISPPVVDSTRTVMVEVPLLRSVGTYVPRSIRRSLQTADAQTLKDVLDALLADGGRLASGKKVVDVDDALAWILEQIRSGLD